MSFLIGSFFARLGIDTGDYAKGMQSAQAVQEVFGKSFSAFVASPVLGSINLFKRAAIGAAEMARDVLGAAEANERLAERTGFATDSLQAMYFALRRSGEAGEVAYQSASKFAAVMGEAKNAAGPAVPILQQLNIELSMLGGSEKNFRLVLDALGRIEDPAVRAALAAKLLGEEAGPKLLNALGKGSQGLDEQIELYTRLGLIVDSNTNAALARMNTTSGQLKDAFEGIKQSAIIAFLEGVSGQASFTDEDITKLAESIRNEIVPAIRDFVDMVSNAIGLLRDLGDLPVVKQVLQAGGAIRRGAVSILGDGVFSAANYAADPSLRRAYDLAESSPEEFARKFEADRQKRLRR